MSLSPRFSFPVYPNIFSPETNVLALTFHATAWWHTHPLLRAKHLSPLLPFMRLRVARGRVKRNGQPDGKSVYEAKERRKVEEGHLFLSNETERNA